MPTNWRVYGKNTVASKLDRSDLPGFFRKKVVVGPNDGAIVVHDGKVKNLLTESKVKVAGVFDQFISLIGLGADIAVYFVDLSPIDLTIFLGETNKENVAGASSSQVEASRSPEQSRTVNILSSADQIGWIEEVEQNEQMSGSVTSQQNISQISILALTADKEIIQAESNIRLRVDPDNVNDFIALLKGKRAIANWDLAALLRDEFFGKILLPEIASHNASDLRGNRDILNRLEQAIRDDMGRSISSCGLTLDNFTIAWGLTEQEQADIARKRAEREEDAFEFVKHRQIAHLLREQEIEKTRIANLQELRMAKGAGDQELQDLLLAGEINRDLMAKGQEVDVARVDAQVREIELDVDKKASLIKLEQSRAEEDLRLDIEEREFRQKNTARLAEIETDDKEMWSMVKMQIEMATSKHDMEMSKRRQESDANFRKMQADIEDRYQQRKLKLDESRDRMGMMERLVDKGLDSGVTDSSVLTEMLKQSTEQEYATTSDDKVRSRSESQAAANNLETYQRAEDREREHQEKMTDLSSKMMNSAKQTPPPTIVTGTPAVSPAAQGPVIINNTPAQPKDSVSQTCSSCNKPIEPNWKACPYCGQSLQSGAK